jgi:hypothetical protein
MEIRKKEMTTPSSMPQAPCDKMAERSIERALDNNEILENQNRIKDQSS